MPASDLVGDVFDLDGTLYDKRPLERYMMRRLPLGLLRLYRYTRVRSSMAGLDLGSWAAIEGEALRRLAPGTRAQARWRQWIADTYDPLVIEGVERAARPYPGAPELLRRLRAAGLRLGLVSDYRGVDARLRALGLDPGAFDFSLTTEAHGLMKPAARAAALTLAGMGAPAAQLLMVGDRAFADQAFAERAGMGFLGVLEPGAAAPSDPRWMPWDQLRARLLDLARG